MGDWPSEITGSPQQQPAQQHALYQQQLHNSHPSASPPQRPSVPPSQTPTSHNTNGYAPNHTPATATATAVPVAGAKRPRDEEDTTEGPGSSSNSSSRWAFSAAVSPFETLARAGSAVLTAQAAKERYRGAMAAHDAAGPPPPPSQHHQQHRPHHHHHNGGQQQHHINNPSPANITYHQNNVVSHSPETMSPARGTSPQPPQPLQQTTTTQHHAPPGVGARGGAATGGTATAPRYHLPEYVFVWVNEAVCQQQQYPNANQNQNHALDASAPPPFYQGTPPAHLAGAHKQKHCGGGTYTCSCPAWRYQKHTGTDKRTCRHLRLLLGDAHEDHRCQGITGGDGDGGGGWLLTGGGGGGGDVTPQRGQSPAAVAGVSGTPGVLLANKASPGGQYTGWWMSEKLDGVRAYWDGQRLLSRNGNVFHAPLWFTQCLPQNEHLDGELFTGRKRFQTSVGIVRSGPTHPGWRTVRYELFDIPSRAAQPFEARMAVLAGLFGAPSPLHSGPTADLPLRSDDPPPVPQPNQPMPMPPPHVRIVEHVACRGQAHSTQLLAAVEGKGGEGLMLRQPNSPYMRTRSSTLLKIKSTADIDAIVRGYDGGKGRVVGKVGALLVELPNGKQFGVGSGLTDADRANPPKIGTVVVVRYQELTDGGVPRFPVFAGCRYDVTWPPSQA